MDADELLPALMHLADSALPIGGYAFSSGLEAAAKLGVLHRPEDLTRYLEGFLEQAGSLELPFLHSFYDGHEAREALLDLEAMMVLPVMKKASVVQGRGLLKWLQIVDDEPGRPALSLWFQEEKLSRHFLAVLGMGMKRMGFRLDDVQQVYLFMILRDQVSSAIRLGLVGPMQGHRIQYHLHRFAGEVRKRHAGKTYKAAVRSCPVLEIAQGFHEVIYSKLFQN